eukprot:m.386471 g.386471  ORF g.386471 m.386471 type:complete len:241 (+) comp56301_c0_seq8:158-880(+)
MSMKEALAPWSPSQALVEDDELALNVYISRSVSRLVHMCLAVARLLCLAGFVCLEVLGVHLLAECPFACLFDCSRVGLNSAPVRWTHWRVMAEACAVPTRAQTWQSPAPPNWAGSRAWSPCSTTCSSLAPNLTPSSHPPAEIFCSPRLLLMLFVGPSSVLILVGLLRAQPQAASVGMVFVLPLLFAIAPHFCFIRGWVLDQCQSGRFDNTFNDNNKKKLSHISRTSRRLLQLGDLCLVEF